MKKYTPKEVRDARQSPLIIKWRASGRNGTIMPNPTVQEFKERHLYQDACNKYVKMMVRTIIIVEKVLYRTLDLKCQDYYTNRYDVTAVENKILRNAILNKL